MKRRSTEDRNELYVVLDCDCLNSLELGSLDRGSFLEIPKADWRWIVVKEAKHMDVMTRRRTNVYISEV